GNVWRHAGYSADPAYRGVVDDRAAAGGAGHRRDLELEAIEHAGQVLLQVRMPCRAGHGVDGAGGGHAARVVDRPVEPAEFRHGRSDQPLNLLLHSDVGGDEERTAATVAQPFRGPLTNIAAPAADHDGGAVGDGPADHRAPDPGGASGNDH